MEKRWKLLFTDEKSVDTLQKLLGLDAFFCRLLVQRGIETEAEARRFLEPSLLDLHDPFLIADMEKAVARLEKALETGEKILLYGDYDVDGTTCVALMWTFLKPFCQKGQLSAYLPDRQTEGYGVSLKSIDFAEKEGFSLMIAMDCGIKAHAAIAAARSRGIDFLVCDHHEPEGGLPDAVAVLDPKRPDCAYPFKELSGCGVVFKFCQAICQKRGDDETRLEKMLDLVAVSTACDIVPMLGENRILTHFGLKRLNSEPSEGLRAIVSRSGRSVPLTVSDLVFGVGPLINVAGRLGDAREAVRALLATDRETAADRAEELSRKNQMRRDIDRNLADEAKALFQSLPDWQTRRSVVLFEKNWHKGIIGIAASRLAEAFNRPTIIFCESEGRAVGSARSAGSFNLYEALKKCEPFLLSFGGHAHAAGLQVAPEKMALFVQKFEETVVESWIETETIPELEIAAELPFSLLSPDFWETLRLFSPFGPSNRNPVFWARAVSSVGQPRDFGKGHFRFSLRQNDSEARMSAIVFDLEDEKAELARSGQPFHLAFSIREEIWRGEAVFQLQIKDIKAIKKQV